MTCWAPTLNKEDRSLLSLSTSSPVAHSGYTKRKQTRTLEFLSFSFSLSFFSSYNGSKFSLYYTYIILIEFFAEMAAHHQEIYCILFPFFFSLHVYIYIYTVSFVAIHWPLVFLLFVAVIFFFGMSFGTLSAFLVETLRNLCVEFNNAQKKKKKTHHQHTHIKRTRQHLHSFLAKNQQ